MAAAVSVGGASASAWGVVACGGPVRLQDVATVRQGYKEREAIIRMAGNEAVELAIYKEGDANTVATADAVAKRLEHVRAPLPPDMELTVIDDQSTFIRHAIADVKLAAVIGRLLAILVLFLLLPDGWITFVVALAL